MTLLPFTPTLTEQQHPLADHYIKHSKHLSQQTLPEDPSRRGSSGSQWTADEVYAVRAVPLIDLDPARIIPEEFFPRDDNSYFVNMCRNLQATDIDDLKQFDSEKYENNYFQLFFSYLATLTRTDLSENEIIRSHQRSISTLSASSANTELSTSSDENSEENVSCHALGSLINSSLMNMGRYKELNVLPGPGKLVPKLNFGPGHVRFKFSLGGARHEAVNDGQIAVNFPSGHSHSDKNSVLSVASIECKPRNAGGLKRGSGDRETFSSRVFAQEVAELIGASLAQYHSRLPVIHRDHESFVISLHGTMFYLSAAYFAPDYIRYLEKQQAEPSDAYLWVRRSHCFDLKSQTERIGALRLLWSLILYLRSGNARVNIVSSAIHESRR